LGGSFNPAHAGHLFISRVALRRLGLHAVWWLVSPGNPLKPRTGMAPFTRRLASARSLAADPRLVVCDLESILGYRYTADTVRALTRRFAATRFVWLIGADNLLQLPRWRRWESILDRVTVAVFPRQPYSISVSGCRVGGRYRARRLPTRAARQVARRRPPAWVILSHQAHPLSATALRRAGLFPDAAPGGENATAP